MFKEDIQILPYIQDETGHITPNARYGLKDVKTPLGTRLDEQPREVDLDTPLEQKKIFPIFQKAAENQVVEEKAVKKKRGRPKKEVAEQLTPQEQEERITRARVKHQLFAEFEKRIDGMLKPDLITEIVVVLGFELEAVVQMYLMNY